MRTSIAPAIKSKSRRVFAFNAGFFKQRQLKRILSLAGYDVRFGLPKEGDFIAIWGQSPTAYRGKAVAKATNASPLFVEDAFLRSLHPGRTASEPPIGVLIDQKGPHFDPSAPTDLEDILTMNPLDDTALLNRARGAIARIRDAHLTKYSGVDPTLTSPAPGYVLVIDQARGDASVTASKAGDDRFREMLVMAQEEHPSCPVIIKTHPETLDGQRPGYFGQKDVTDRVSLCTEPYSPWVLFDGAVGVYTVSSQMGFEAIFAGHKPRIFGQPFYAGWGLTTDEFPVARRERKLTRAQLFAAAMILYPIWYDPNLDRLCTLEDSVNALDANVRAWREDRRGWNAIGMRLWKRGPLQKIFGRVTRMTFDKHSLDRPDMVWANKPGSQGATRIEDGFLRSRGLGAELVPPLSLVCDDLGIYYDPTKESRLERLIAKRVNLRPDQRLRAENLIDSLRELGLSKYNLGGKHFKLPVGHKILVTGQVEDDASILVGAGPVCTNRNLLLITREANPDAIILYKPHPDVEAGLRKGVVPDAADLSDMVLEKADMAALLAQVSEVWTMTSLTGFEALIRGCKVVTTGAPFYAGWSLTNDQGTVPKRRKAKPDLAGLVHAALIDYPRYFDPSSGLPCSVETIVERLKTGEISYPGSVNRLLSKIQGRLISHKFLWR
ncbi:capsular polysaccharide biosynthesis protein [Pseudopelagicola sp. nBUS_20]|uniref:capsular polysaccharide biosynthesis protein n=1 Tax=Pseudopelagicola sp. nBUS_20 TaxID=3395317 RepID=UPI003EB7B584